MKALSLVDCPVCPTPALLCTLAVRARAHTHTNTHTHVHTHTHTADEEQEEEEEEKMGEERRVVGDRGLVERVELVFCLERVGAHVHVQGHRGANVSQKSSRA